MNAIRTAVIDRIDEGIATLIPDDGGAPLTLPLSEEFFEGQTVVITKDGVRPALAGETPPRPNKDRLKNLFNKNKKD